MLNVRTKKGKREPDLPFTFRADLSLFAKPAVEMTETEHWKGSILLLPSLATPTPINTYKKGLNSVPIDDILCL